MAAPEHAGDVPALPNHGENIDDGLEGIRNDDVDDIELLEIAFFGSSCCFVSTHCFIIKKRMVLVGALVNADDASKFDLEREQASMQQEMYRRVTNCSSRQLTDCGTRTQTNGENMVA